MMSKAQEKRCYEITKDRNHRKPELYPIDRDIFNPDKHNNYGINWSARGTTSIKETEEFIEELKEAIAIAREINSIE